MHKNKAFKFSIIIPAAGNSSRLGTIKQLVRVKHKSLINRAIEHAVLAEPEEIVIILGHAAQKIKDQIHPKKHITILENKQWQNGLLNSIQLACKYILKQEDITHVLIMHADQYQVDTHHISELILKAKDIPETIIASSYSNTFGVPCVFPISFLRKILSLEIGKNVKSLLQIEMNAGHVHLQDLPQASFDLDTPEDLQKLRSKYGL